LGSFSARLSILLVADARAKAQHANNKSECHHYFFKQENARSLIQYGSDHQSLEEGWGTYFPNIRVFAENVKNLLFILIILYSQRNKEEFNLLL